MKSVYVISVPNGPVKIGSSGSPALRLRSLQTGFPTELKLHHQQQSTDAHLAERAAHYILREKRLHGEWFDVSVDAAIAAVASVLDAMQDPDWVAPWVSDRPAKRYAKSRDGLRAFTMRVNAEFLESLDALRMAHVEQPSRAEMIRKLVAQEAARSLSPTGKGKR